MSPPVPLLPLDLGPFDGFHGNIDWAAVRADIVLDRPPLDIIRMSQRDQLRRAVEAPVAKRTAKKLLNELEGHCYSRLRCSDDFRESVAAFHAKRPPRFRGT